MAIAANLGDLDDFREQARPTSKIARSHGGGLWGLTICLCMIYGLFVKPLDRDDVQTLAGMVCEHWMLMILLVIPILIVAGKLGRGLGLPGLFRNPVILSNTDRLQASRPAFWGSLGATLLVAQVWTGIYYEEMVELCRQMGPGSQAETFVNLRPSGSLSEFARQAITQPEFWNHGELLVFLFRACCPFLALLFVAEVLPGSAPGLDRRGWSFLEEVGMFLLGMVVGSIVVVVSSIVDAYYFHQFFVRGWDLFYLEVNKNRHFPLLGWQFTSPTFFSLDMNPSVNPHIKSEILASHSVYALTLVVIYLSLTQVFRRKLSPGIGICIILGVVAVVCSLMAMLSTTGQAVTLAAGLGLFVGCNFHSYKYQFPRMANYYARGKRVNLLDTQAIADRAKGVSLLPRGDETLTRWKASTGQEKPKLVLVATTGGAYRASFWTTVVLDELGRCIPGFSRHVRLLTGASGGMVGAAYYSASMTKDGPPEGGVTELLRRESNLDSLTPVIRRLVCGDLPRAFSPFRQKTDRGVTLERTWTTLARTFPDLIEGEREGWRPSLVVSPMVIESGRRLLISNLDLGNLAENRAGVRGEEPEPDSASGIYSRPAAEFFRCFPEAHETFRLQTAVRMSATFPFASPAVSLPTNPPRRVVDAGYYDNYGVDLAASWIYEHRQWIRRNTSGVALIQIRAYPCAAATLASLALEQHENQSRSAAFVQAVRTSFQGLTSPLEGGVNAREWSMRFRNASQLRILDDLFNDDPGQPRMFETFVFENFAEFAMNWFISNADIDDMNRTIGATGPVDPPANLVGSSHAVETAAMTTSDPKRILSALKQDCEDATLFQKQRLIQWWEGRSPR